MSTAGLTARYLTSFRCLGADCEDTCCQGWRVPVDERRYQIMKRAMSGTPEERAAFAAQVQAPGDGDGHVRMRPDGTCSFLTPARLCAIHAAHGQQALPAVCATYPRSIARAGARLEVFAALSCPEIARLVLLQADALELVDAPAELANAGEPTRVLPLRPELPYDQHLEEVRAAALAVLSLREEAMTTRLFLLAHLGQQTAGFFRKDAAHVDGAQLAAALAQLQRPETIALWRRELGAMPAPRALTANLVLQLARARTEVEAGVLRGLLADTLAAWGDGITFDDVGQVSVSPAGLWGAYAERRQFWQQLHGPRIDLYFENYAKNFWLRDWYTSSIDLLAHARRLLVRVAVLRLLLFMHPALVAARALDAPARAQALDRAAVEVFYKLSRAVEHESTFLDRIAATVVAGGLQTLAHSTFLALV